MVTTRPAHRPVAAAPAAPAASRWREPTKRRLDDLAVLGGPAAFDEPVMVGRPNLGDRTRLMARIGEALDRHWLSNGGPLVLEFERRVAELAGVRHCVATCNATSGLQLALRAARLRGEVIVPSLTFAATAHAVRWLGLVPVFCDVDRRTANLDPDCVEAAVTPRTSAIVGVHLWGRPCDVPALEEVAARHDLTLLFDAAHAFGASLAGRPVGGFGQAEVFSFHATKMVNAFEGGAVVTDDEDFARRVRSLHNFGFDDAHEVQLVGTNAKMSEASAAMGLTSLEAMEHVVAHNQAVYHGYRDGLSGLPGVSLVAFDERDRHNYQYAVVLLDEAACDVGPDLLMRVLRAENIIARRYFSPGCHRMRPYQTSRGLPLPQTDALAARALALPTGTQLDLDGVARICDVVRAAVGSGARLAERTGTPPPHHRPASLAS